MSGVYVVGVGASAGGLDAVTRLLAAAPAETGMCFVVIQHLSPDYRSMLAELLASHTSLHVSPAEHGVPVRPDTVYVIQPQTLIRLRDGKLHIEQASERVNQPINVFFRSMAKACKERCAGIVLSGTGSDGAEGLRAIKDAGGVAVAQRPETASFNGMPEAALATGVVDLVLRPGEMVAELEAFAGEANQPGAEPSDVVVLGRVLSALRTHTGVDFSYYKPSTIERRVERRMRHLGVAEVREYARRLKDDAAEAYALQRDLLIGVTKFLRDEGAIDAMRQIAMPRLVAKPGTHPLRLWVAGCSTGEEAYSVAILLHSALDEAHQARDFKIFATDIDPHALDAAGRGEFSRSAMAALPAELRQRYFTQRGELFVVAKGLREHLLFSRHNAITDPPFPRMDLISCRNLLIYLKPSIQDRVLRMFGNSLTTGGMLWLGSSESLGDQEGDYDVLDTRWKLFQVKPSRARSIVVPIGHGQRPALPADRPTERPAMGRLAETLLRGYLPPCIVVDKSLIVQYHYGDFRGVLQLAQGRLTFDLREMLPREVGVLCSTAVQRVFKTGEEVRYLGLTVPIGDGEDARFDLVARELPLKHGNLVGLIFEGFGDVGEAERHKPPTIPPMAVDMRERLAELEEELARSRHNLQATVEELESSNEELQATNEELVAANEELQSTNEELQSVNEELHSVNAEHGERLEELTTLTEDLDSLLSSLEVGVLFLDPSLCIRRFNPRACDFVNVLPQDTGRPLAHLSHRLQYARLLDDCATALRTGAPLSHRVMADDRHVLLRITPVVSEQPHVRGLVLSLSDVTELVEASDQASRLSLALDQAPTARCVLDADGRIVQASTAFAALTGRDPRYLLGTPLSGLAAAPDRPVVTEAVELALRGGGWAGILSNERPDGAMFWEAVHLLPSRNEQGHVVGVIRVSEDISESVAALLHSDAPLTPNQLGLFRWDTSEDVAECNPAFSRMNGLNPLRRLSHAGLEEALQAEDRDAWHACIAGALSAASPRETEYTAHGAHGASRLRLRVMPIDGGSGRGTRVIGRTCVAP